MALALLTDTQPTRCRTGVGVGHAGALQVTKVGQLRIRAQRVIEEEGGVEGRGLVLGFSGPGPGRGHGAGRRLQHGTRGRPAALESTSIPTVNIQYLILV
jgi:hypothetical protein